MNLEEQLKNVILSKYRSIRAFTESIEIPYSTLDSVLRNGIMKAGVNTMLKVFDALDLDIESVAGGQLQFRNKVQVTTSTSGLSDRALTVAKEYDKACDDIKNIVDVALKILPDDEFAEEIAIDKSEVS